MLTKLEQYRYKGELHRQALTELPNVGSLSIEEKNKLNSAVKLGKWLTIGVQCPVVLGAVVVFEKLKSLPTDKKIVSYVAGVGFYGMFYMLSKAWAWHTAFHRVEGIVKEYVLTADIEEIQKIQQEQQLGISSKPKQIYTPK